jgi:hypothetical protein
MLQIIDHAYKKGYHSSKDAESTALETIPHQDNTERLEVLVNRRKRSKPFTVAYLSFYKEGSRAHKRIAGEFQGPSLTEPANLIRGKKEAADLPQVTVIVNVSPCCCCKTPNFPLNITLTLV